MCLPYEAFLVWSASRARCLYGWLKKDVDFDWTDSHQAAFEDLKTALVDSSMVVCYDPKRKTRLMTDASGESVGAVVLQEVRPDDWRPVTYASRSLSQAEKNYTVTEKECLAIIFALKKFRVYLIDMTSKLITLKGQRTLKSFEVG